MVWNNWLEIERKFLIDGKNLPNNLDNFQHEKIEQWYLSITNDREERIRHRWDKYYHTIKTWLWEVRWEDEHQITKDNFEALWPKTKWLRIEKTRYIIPYNNHKIELDIYEWLNKWLIVAEIEFNDKENCDSFEHPDWFGEDVTDNPKYKNRNLAK